MIQVNISPSLRDIFYEYDFTEETTPELHKWESVFDKNLKKLTGGNFEKFESVDNPSTEIKLEAQYIGFVQGFKFARSLFTGDLFTADKRGEGE